MIQITMKGPIVSLVLLVASCLPVHAQLDSYSRLSTLESENALLEQRNRLLQDQVKALKVKIEKMSNEAEAAKDAEAVAEAAAAASTATATAAGGTGDGGSSPGTTDSSGVPEPSGKTSPSQMPPPAPPPPAGAVVEESPPTDLVPNPPTSLWKNEIAVGGSINRGNTDSYEGTINDRNDRVTANDKLHFGLLGDFKELQGSSVANRARGEVQYDHEISGRLYGYGKASLENDEILELTYRGVIGPGLGYYLIKEQNVTFSIEGGPALQVEKYHALPEHTTPQGIFADHFNWQITPNFQLFQNAEATTDMADLSNYRYEVDGGFESSISKRLKVRLTAEDRYDSQPVSGKYHNDFGAITSLVWDF